MNMEVVHAPSNTVLLGTGGVDGGGVLAVYMEVVPDLSVTVPLDTLSLQEMSPGSRCVSVQASL